MSKYAYSFVAAATLAIAAPVFYSKTFNYACYGKNQMLRKLCVELINKDLKLTMSLPDLEEN